ncbi:hypothetical protein EKD04_025885 [Chloroflexales bacterium ZM16-3]|nr:hypothetical protein [Chloroflexales bacterium ZM16-3]
MRYVMFSLLLALAHITPAQAQEPPPALVVTLRDVTGAGVPGIAVVVTDRSGATVLARETTGAAWPPASWPCCPVRPGRPAAACRTSGPAWMPPSTPSGSAWRSWAGRSTAPCSC